MIETAVRDAKQKMDQILGALRDQLASLHIGRANASLVEHVLVEHYGTKMPIRQVGSITVPEANQIVITPWDKGALGPIEVAIRQSDLGVNPINDGLAVRIVLPQLTEERRRDLLKIVGKMAEEARIALRNERRDVWDKLQDSQKNGSLTQDDRDRGRDQLDKLIEQMNKEVEAIVAAKEKDMLAL